MYSPWFVTVMGIGTVFFGLICIIFLTMAMGKIMSSRAKAHPAAPAAANDVRAEVQKIAAAAPTTSYDIPPSVIVAILAALSEDPSITGRGYHVTSIKKSDY